MMYRYGRDVSGRWSLPTSGLLAARQRQCGRVASPLPSDPLNLIQQRKDDRYRYYASSNGHVCSASPGGIRVCKTPDAASGLRRWVNGPASGLHHVAEEVDIANNAEMSSAGNSTEPQQYVGAA